MPCKRALARGTHAQISLNSTPRASIRTSNFERSNGIGASEATLHSEAAHITDSRLSFFHLAPPKRRSLPKLLSSIARRGLPVNLSSGIRSARRPPRKEARGEEFCRFVVPFARGRATLRDRGAGLTAALLFRRF